MFRSLFFLLLISCQLNGQSFFPAKVLVGRPITVSKSNAVLDYAGIEFIAERDLDYIFKFTGDNCTIRNLKVNGGLDYYTPQASSQARRVGILDTGTGNTFQNCESGYGHKGPHAAAFEFSGKNTKVNDCIAREAGRQSYRCNADGLEAVNCSSFHNRNRPEMTGTSRRHWTFAATNSRKIGKVSVEGGSWMSHYQWSTSVADVGTGTIQELSIKNIYINHSGLAVSVGNPNIAVLKFDGVKKIYLKGIRSYHPNVNGAMFANIASVSDVELVKSKVDGYIGYSFSSTGTGGGSLLVDQVEMGLNVRNPMIIGGYQTNNPKNVSQLKNVLIRDIKARATGIHHGSVFWFRSRDGDHEWRFDGSIDLVIKP